MPFAKSQAVLRRILPEWGFTQVYKLAIRGYSAWRRISDELYYSLLYGYHTVKRDSTKSLRIKTITSVRPYSMVGRGGLLATYDIAQEIETKGIPGSFVECGVARGGCSALMASVARENGSGRKIWLFDSFEGLPEPTQEDMSCVDKTPTKERSKAVLHPGYCLGTYEEVSRLFSDLGLNKGDVFMVKGWFQDTLPAHREEIGGIAFLRLDGDWYESTKCCLENLYDNVTPGGYIYIDDYELSGCKKAVDEFLQNRGTIAKLTHDGRGGAYFVKGADLAKV